MADSWRQRLTRPLWSLLSIPWPLVFALLGLAMLVGVWGSYSLPDAGGIGIWDHLYRAFQLFVVDGGFSGPVTERFQVARFLGLILAVLLALKGFEFAFPELVRRLRIRGTAGHVVICGLSITNLHMARHFRTAGKRVIVIERDRNHSLRVACDEVGAWILFGDATSPALLAASRVERSARVVVDCGSDATNSNVALQVLRRHTEAGQGSLLCSVHIVDSELCTLLRTAEMRGAGDPAFEFDFFNAYETCARHLSERVAVRVQPGEFPAVVVVGLGALGRALVVEIARLARGSRPSRPVELTIVDPQATGLTKALVAKHPLLATSCSIQTVDLDQSAVGSRLRFTGDSRLAERSVFVCLEDPSAATAVALHLAQEAEASAVDILVALPEESGLVDLLRIRLGDRAAVRPVGLAELVATTEMALYGSYGLIARSIHEAFVEEEGRKGVGPADNAALVPWEALAEEVKRSNFEQARDIGRKLRAVGCSLMPMTELEVESFRFTQVEVEILARVEHDRWMAERHGSGWKVGPRDREKKTHPDLVPWEDLTEEAKEKDRFFGRLLPDLLARGGYQIVRIPRAADDGSSGGPTETKMATGRYAFLFSDIHESTQLWVQDPDGMSKALALHDTLVRQAILAAGGTIFTTAGDSFSSAFRDGESALRAVFAAKKALVDAAWQPPGPLHVRWGVHFGWAEWRLSDFYGIEVIRCARLLDVALPNQLVATEEFLAASGSLEQFTLRELGELPLKGFEGQFRVYSIDEL